MFKLVIADDEGKTFVVPLVRDEISIGRKEGNTIRLTERNVSRKHARLKRANGSFHLEDLSSYNGVKVNGKKIGGETDLKAGDQITIGDYQLALQVEGADTQPTVPEAPAPMLGAPGAEAVTSMIAAPGGPPARLVMMSPPNPGQEFALNRASMRLGRAEDLDIWVNHRSISREHAEIRMEGDTYRISDMASANGLRVNGADTRNTVLQPGDTIEIGQVRFKFVGPGEQFVFDEGRTMQMDAVNFGADGPNRTPMYIAAGIVGLAIIAGIMVVALGSGGPPPEPTATFIAPPTPPGAAGPPLAVGPGAGGVPAPAPSDADVAAAVAACRTALNSGNFPLASEHANRALALRPDDSAAHDCLNAADAAQSEADIFARALAAQTNLDLDTAVMEIESLAPDSGYHSRPEAAQIVSSWAEMHVSLAESTVAADGPEARRLAEGVLAVSNVPAPLRARAEAVIRATRPAIARAGGSGGGTGPVRVVAGGSSSGLPAPPGVGPRGGSSGSSGSSSGGPAGGSSSSGGAGSSSSGAGASSSSGGGSSSSGGATADEDDGASLYDAARAAALTGNHREVIRLLNGHARAQREYELLIASLRAVPGMETDVVRNMRAYLTRFPGTPRAQGYQQYLMTHGD